MKLKNINQELKRLIAMTRKKREINLYEFVYENGRGWRYEIGEFYKVDVIIKNAVKKIAFTVELKNGVVLNFTAYAPKDVLQEIKLSKRKMAIFICLKLRRFFYSWHTLPVQFLQVIGEYGQDFTYHLKPAFVDLEKGDYSSTLEYVKSEIFLKRLRPEHWEILGVE